MSIVSGYIQASAVLAAQAQDQAVRGRRLSIVQPEDPARVLRRVDGVELSDAVPQAADSRSDQARQERRRPRSNNKGPEGVRKVDVTA